MDCFVFLRLFFLVRYEYPTEYIGGFLFRNDQLAYLHHEEGKAAYEKGKIHSISA